MTDEPAIDGTRRQVLTAIRTSATPPTVDELAERLQLHPNSIRLHAAALREAGYVVQESRSGGGRGRPLTVYSPTPRGARAGHRNYEVLAEVLVEHLASTDDPASAARDAGRAWGARLAAERDDAGSLTSTVLGELGFEPDSRGSSIELRNCPFRELVDSHQRVVCALHAGMLDGLAVRDGCPVTLLPFTSPSRCTVRFAESSQPRYDVTP